MNPTEPLMDAWKKTASQSLEPARKINLFLVDQIAEMTDQQLKTMESYGLLALAQLKKAAEVRDQESAHTFTLSQADFYSNLTKKALMDAREVSQRNQEIANEVTKLLQDAKTEWTAKK
ncbi:phasin family protein [Marinospirillum sp.]|uniref:phasin family protein n=1 Tax=Marinospirillum sp. TaxID=2183934 RepID=UPI00384A8859